MAAFVHTTNLATLESQHGRAVQVRSSGAVRFGVFELDLAARELRKRGVRVRLQDQPFRVLEALLEKPGSVVTREELKERLWAQDEFVEFDKSLNTAVQKIRQALNDSAETPRFVETIPRRGYRFVAPVQATVSGEVPSGTRRLAIALGLTAVVVLAAFGWRFQQSAESGRPTGVHPKSETDESGTIFSEWKRSPR